MNEDRGRVWPLMKAGEAPQGAGASRQRMGTTRGRTLEDSGEVEGRPWGGQARGGEARRVPCSAAGGPGV